MPPSTPTSPCPGCGHPVAHTALLCTFCGQHIRAGVQLETRLGKPEHTAPPPIPTIAPGPARFRSAPTDENARRVFIKSILTLAACAGIVLAWKAGEDGPAEAAHYSARLGISIAGAWVICILESTLFLEVGVNIALAASGIAASIAAGDLTQHILHYTLMPALPQVFGAIVCIFCLADLLDIDYHDAAFLGLAIWLMKIILAWTLFASMFEPAN